MILNGLTCAGYTFHPREFETCQLLRRMTGPAGPNLVRGAFADLSRVRAELLAENALLRQQLIVIRRRTNTPRLTWQERLMTW